MGLSILLSVVMLSAIFPAALQSYKLVLLSILMVVLLAYAVTTRIRLPLKKEILFFALVYSVFGLTWSLYGELVSNPGALRVVTVMVIYPLLFTLIGVFWQNDKIVFIQKVMIWIGFALVASLMTYLLSASGSISGGYYNFMQGIYDYKSVFDQGEGYLLFTHPSVSSLLFFIPFLMVFAFLKPGSNLFIFLIFLLMVILVVMTGRRAFFLSFGFSLAFFFFVYVFYFKKSVGSISKNKLVLAGIFTFFASLYLIINFEELNLQVYLKGFFSIFDFSSDVSNLERTNQFFSLLSGITESPLLGSGAGAAADYSRSKDQPWVYELSYVALIFQYGILGFLFYLIGVLYIFFRLLIIIKDRNSSNNLKLFVFAYMCGMVSFLVANSTNPYLAKFDYMWVLFLPVAIINSHLIEKGLNANKYSHR